MARKGRSFQQPANLVGPKQRIVRKAPTFKKEIHVPNRLAKR